jgi:hypothetical protein
MAFGSGLQTTKCRPRVLTLKGVDIRQLVVEFNVYGSIHKPYLTGKMHLNDQTNLIENMGIKGGEDVVYSWDCGGISFAGRLKLLMMTGEQPEPANRSQKYTIDMIGNEYFKDKANIVQQSFGPGTPGSAAIATIHGQYIGGGLQMRASSGVLSQQSYVVSGKNPFTAIDDIKRHASWGTTENPVYFMSYHGMVLSTIGALLAAKGGTRFIQKTTWGVNWLQDQTDTVFAIISIVAKANGSCGAPGHRGAVGAIAGALSQAMSMFDIRTLENVMSKMGTGMGSIGGLSGVGGGNGGKPNYHLNDSASQSASQNPLSNSTTDQLFSASMKNGRTFIVKVPIQGGLFLDVGGGVTLQLIPPQGGGTAHTSVASGDYLVTELAHSFALDDREFGAVSLMTATQSAMEVASA